MNRFDRWGILLLLAALAATGAEGEWLRWASVVIGGAGAVLLLWSEQLETAYWRRREMRHFQQVYAAERRRAEMEE